MRDSPTAKTGSGRRGRRWIAVATIGLVLSLGSSARAQDPADEPERLFLPLMLRNDDSLSPSSRFEMIEQFGGRTRVLAGIDDRVYMDIGPRIARFERQESGRLEMRGMSPILPSFVHRLGVDETHRVALLSNGELQVLVDGEDGALQAVASMQADSKTAVSAVDQILVDGDRVLLSSSDSIEVYDLSEPAAPRFESRILPEALGECSHFGGIATYRRLLVAACGNGLYLLDIAKPMAPRVVGRHLEEVDEGLPMVGIRDPVVVSQFVLVRMSQVRMQWGRVIDLSDPGRPTAVEGNVPGLFDARQLESDGRYVYAINHQERLSVLDIDAAGRAEIMVSQAAPPGDFLGVGARKVFFRTAASIDVLDVVERESEAFLTQGESHPRFLCAGSENPDVLCHAFEDRIVSVSNSTICLRYVEALAFPSETICGENPLHARWLSVATGVEGLWISDGVELIFLADRGEGELVAETSIWLDEGDGFDFRSLHRVGEHLVIIKSSTAGRVYEERIEIHDVSRPTDRVRLSTLDRTGALSTALVEAQGRVWLATLFDLHELDLRDPSAPDLRKRLDLPTSLETTRADGQFLYRFAGGDNRYRIWPIDIAEPERPKLGAVVQVPGKIGGIRVSDGIAAFVTKSGGAGALDIWDAAGEYLTVLNRPSYFPNTENRDAWRDVIWARDGRFALVDRDGGLVILGFEARR